MSDDDAPDTDTDIDVNMDCQAFAAKVYFDAKQGITDRRQRLEAIDEPDMTSWKTRELTRLADFEATLEKINANAFEEVCARTQTPTIDDIVSASD
tara:strand:+ start:151 stop:438 length:288 start_codon:yes stop_codon:yes gene_type:complete